MGVVHEKRQRKYFLILKTFEQSVAESGNMNEGFK
jgi:hypothetical protein